MSDIEQRLQAIEDRFALQDLVTAYCTAVDTLSDLDGLMACFTEDAVFDLSGLGLTAYKGQAAIREFFAGVFETMTHHAHYNTNFRIVSLDGDRGECRVYIMGMGIDKKGNSVLVHARYDLQVARTAGGWKIARFEEPLLMPLGDAVAEMHG